jgi:hypothetical protein
MHPSSGRRESREMLSLYGRRRLRRQVRPSLDGAGPTFAGAGAVQPAYGRVIPAEIVRTAR